MRLSGKVALVTGSTRGIGRAIAWRLAKEGAAVVVTGRNAEAAAKVAEEIRAEGFQAIGKGLDVADSQSVDALVKEISSEAGDVSILVNNAGITKDTLLLRMQDDDWDSVLDINLKGAYYCSQRVLRGMMKKRWGRIINVSSIVGLVGNPGQVNYAASKAALIGFTKSLAKEVASRGITVNAVAPGFIDSDMTQALSQEQRDALAEKIPQGKIGSPEDVAGCIAFLASDDAAYVTGHTLVVDGGMAM